MSFLPKRSVNKLNLFVGLFKSAGWNSLVMHPCWYMLRMVGHLAVLLAVYPGLNMKNSIKVRVGIIAVS